MTDSTITIVVPIKARPECRSTVRERLINLARQTGREAGNVFYRLHEAEADPAAFVIYERWRDQAALDFHMDQDYLKTFLAESEAWLREPIQGTVCREIEL